MRALVDTGTTDQGSVWEIEDTSGDTVTGITITSTSNTYLDCYTALNGGALYPSTDGPTVIADSASSYTNMAAAGKGGAIYCSGECTFTGSGLLFSDVAAQEGGAVYIYDSAVDTFTVASWLLNKAYATNEGAAIYYEDTASGNFNLAFTENISPFAN